MNTEKDSSKKVRTAFGFLLTCLLILFFTLSTLLFFSTVWVLTLWSNLTFDEVVFHLRTSLEGTSSSMLVSYFLRCALPTIFAVVLASILILRLHDRRKRIIKLLLPIASCGMLVTAFFAADHKLGVINYVKAQLRVSTFIEKNYVDPADVALEFPEQKRNLVYLYLESMEGTYADKENGGWFDYNIIPELTALSAESEDFSGDSGVLNGGYSMPGTTWTVGALFAETSGLPLQIPIAMNDMDTQTAFFPTITTLGDILEDNGYEQVFLMGSEGNFGGRSLYFTEHGHYLIDDYNLALSDGRLPNGYYEWWGYEDEKLFSFAKDRLLELSQTGKPFNLSLLTADTHFPDGYDCHLCRDDFDSQYANVLACTNRQAVDFVRWIQQQDFYENTTIVISGDHPTMDAFCDEVDNAVYRREVYTAFINAPIEPVNPDAVRDYTTFDYFPTTLAALGVKIEGDRLGLGTNLYSAEPTLVETYGWFDVIDGVEAKSTFMQKLAHVDMDSEELLKRMEENNKKESDD